MMKENTRVMLASEYPETRRQLCELVMRETGGIVVGEAANFTKATTLARNLRPDIVIMDSRLPYTQGLDGVSLSRMGGLDAAQAISRETREIGVVLLGNLDTGVLGELDLGPTREAYLARHAAGAKIPLSLQGVSDSAGTVVFANVEIMKRMTLRQGAMAHGQGGNLERVIGYSEAAGLLGGFAIVGGLLLVGTMIFAPVGVALIVLGAGMLLFGKVVGETAALWLKTALSRGKRRTKKES